MSVAMEIFTLGTRVFYYLTCSNVQTSSNVQTRPCKVFFFFDKKRFHKSDTLLRQLRTAADC